MMQIVRLFAALPLAFVMMGSSWSLSAAGVAPRPVQESFVTVAGGKFRAGAQDYRAMGFTAYELNIGKDQRKNPREKVERIFRVARAHGFTLFRATTIIYDFKTGDLARHLSEPVWSQIDLILDVARTLGMRVIIDFSTLTYDTGRYSDPPFDVTAPENFGRVKDVYRVIPNRRNTLNGRLYKDDPTILAYSILGEIVPFGLNKLPGGGPDLKNESRDVNNYLAFIANAAAELKRNAPRQLVNAGGLLHVTPAGPVQDRTGAPYWKMLWADRNIDFGSVHIYSRPPKALERPVRPPYPVPMPWGEWKNLAAYASYTDSIGKPFVVEEWGVNLESRSDAVTGESGEKPLELSPEAARDYVANAFAAMSQASVPVAIMWQWSPGGKFNIWPGESALEDSLVAIIADKSAYFRTKPGGTTQPERVAGPAKSDIAVKKLSLRDAKGRLLVLYVEKWLGADAAMEQVTVLREGEPFDSIFSPRGRERPLPLLQLTFSDWCRPIPHWRLNEDESILVPAQPASSRRDLESPAEHLAQPETVYVWDGCQFRKRISHKQP